MKLSQFKTCLTAAIFAGATLVVFQNCSPVDFKNGAEGNLTKADAGYGNEDDSDFPVDDDPTRNPPKENDSDDTAYDLQADCDKFGYPVAASMNPGDVDAIPSVTGGKHNFEVKSVRTIGPITGGQTKIIATESIGSVGAITGGHVAIVSPIIGSLGTHTGGTLCIHAGQLDDLSLFTGGIARVESVRGQGRIPRVAGLTGGFKVFKNYKIDYVDSGTGGTLRIENSDVGTLVLGTGGKVELINSHADLIIQSQSTSLRLVNSTYDTLQ